MNKKITVITVLLLLILILSACNANAAAPEKTVESYLTAIVEADLTEISNLSCAEWEEDAWLELDSFQGVEVSLVDMQCSQSGTDADNALVTCSGHFLTSYDGEAMEIDLSTREYELVQEGGNWLVCGYR